MLLGVRITALRTARAGFELGGEQGNIHGVVDPVVISAPAPQAADLLEQSPEAGTRVTALRAAVSDPAVMILAGMRIRTPSSLEPFAVETPFARITAESAKGREPIDGVVPVVARIAPDRSADLFDAADGDILADLAPRLSALCGAVGEPAWTQVKRWRYATLPARLDPEVVNPPAAASWSAATPSRGWTRRRLCVWTRRRAGRSQGAVNGPKALGDPRERCRFPYDVIGCR